MKVEIELDDLSTSAIQDIIDAMEPDRAEAEKDLDAAVKVTRDHMERLNKTELDDKEYDKLYYESFDIIDNEREYRQVYERISHPMELMQRELAERNGELE